jgi:UDP-2,3-diacylglucosamine hydrolase
LGTPNDAESRIRERKIVAWLHSITHDCDALYLMGDVFDFWYEYRYTAPKGFVRLLGKLAEMSDAGIPIFFFPGNHDLWVKEYLDEEIGWKTIRRPIRIELQGKQCLLGHGDGLGPGDHGFKWLRKLFDARWAQWLFSRLHPNFSFAIARKWSKSSRDGQAPHPAFLGEKEFLVAYGREQLQKAYFDYQIMGHRHQPMMFQLTEKSTYCNLGDWIHAFTYAEMHEGILSLKKWEK